MSGAKKPTAAHILAISPLSKHRMLRGARACNLCGQLSATLRLYRECDEYDRPITDAFALLFVGADHADCIRRVDDHPRLYVEDRGAPGTFPKLCGNCVHREGFACKHPSLKANGGSGLKVGLAPSAGIIICSRPGGCHTPLAHALDCEGQELPGETLSAGGGA